MKMHYIIFLHLTHSLLIDGIIYSPSSNIILPLSAERNSSSYAEDEGEVSAFQAHVDTFQSTAGSADLYQENHDFVTKVRQVEDLTATQHISAKERNPSRRPRKE